MYNCVIKLGCAPSCPNLRWFPIVGIGRGFGISNFYYRTFRPPLRCTNFGTSYWHRVEMDPGKWILRRWGIWPMWPQFLDSTGFLVQQQKILILSCGATSLWQYLCCTKLSFTRQFREKISNSKILIDKTSDLHISYSQCLVLTYLDSHTIVSVRISVFQYCSDLQKLFCQKTCFYRKHFFYKFFNQFYSKQIFGYRGYFPSYYRRLQPLTLIFYLQPTTSL